MLSDDPPKINLRFDGEELRRAIRKMSADIARALKANWWTMDRHPRIRAARDREYIRRIATAELTIGRAFVEAEADRVRAELGLPVIKR